MEKADFQKALEELKNKAPKRNFKQTIDLILNLKDLDLKKPEQQMDVWAQLPHALPKKKRVAALVGPELAEQARQYCDTVVTHENFKKFDDKKLIKKLARDHDYFIAQANLMPDVAKTFGKVLGPRSKMPNPKAGCVVPPNANLAPIIDRLQKTLHLTAKTQLSIKCAVGTEEMLPEQVIENATTVYNTVVNALPQEERNIKNVMLKLTMSKPVQVTTEKTKKNRKNSKARNCKSA